MKNLLTFTLLFLSYPIFSQSYLESNPEWTETTVNCLGFCVTREYTIKLEADTTINNIVYYKTKRDGIITTWDWTVDTLVSENIIDDYLNPLREDQGKFYMYNLSQNEDQLLHDFNLSVGDTAISLFCPEPQIVKQIDTVYFGTQMRKKFLFDSQPSLWSTPLYEGIGTIGGLFVQPCNGFTGVESSNTLQCYIYDNQILQFDPTSPCRSTTNTTNITSSEFQIYPNPFDKKIRIEKRWPSSNKLNVKIFDFHGRLVNAQQIFNSEDLIEISTNELGSGKYVLVIYENDKIYASKMIKVEE